jgi:hypothetical protein
MELDAETCARFEALESRMRAGGKLIVSQLAAVDTPRGGAAPKKRVTVLVSQAEYRRIAKVSKASGCQIKQLAARLIRQGLGIAA